MAKPSKENFYKKLRYHAGISESTTKESNHGAQGTLIGVTKSNDGTSYGIVKENHHYYIKKSTLKEGHKASDFIYISGLQNKTEYQYNSLAEAEKQRNFFVQGLNEAFSLQPKKVAVEEKKIEKIDNPFSYIKETVNKGKVANKLTLENRFKKTITEDKKTAKKVGLMSETATMAIRKAMGLVTEDKAISTEDSEVKKKDVLPDKTGKEDPQAPINDSNAKTEAEKAMGKDKSDYVKVPKGGKSIAVNQQSEKLKEEASPLVTDDSELIVNQSLANMDNAAKEKPQAPINDANAKTTADKATGGQGSASLPNNAEESKESDPLDDKEDAGDEKGDIVSEAKAISTEDSEQKKSDEIANSSAKVGTPEAPYNSYNQPDKGHKDGAKKGEELKPKESKKDIVAEGDLSTEDSEANPKDSLANKTTTNLPKKTGKSEIVADSNLKPEQTLANDTTTNLPNAIAEGDDLSTADSEIDAAGSLANEKGGNVTYDRGKTQPDASYSMDDNSIAEDEETAAKLDSAGDDIENLDIEIDAEKAVAAEPVAEPVPEVPAEDPLAVGGEEMPAEDPLAVGGEEMPMDLDGGADAVDDLGLDGVEMPVEDPLAAGGEVPAEGGNTEEVVRELKSKSGEMGELVRNNPEVADDAEVAKEVINQTIEPFNTENMEHGDQQKIINKIKGEEDDMGGEPAPEGGEEVPAEDNGELPIPAPDVPELGGEQPPLAEKEICTECGTFEQYAESRGYDSFEGTTIAEVANVISGYANAFNEGMNDGDFAGTAKYMTEGVIKELADYGQDSYITESESKKKELTEAGVDFGVVEVPTSGDVENISEEQLDELGWRDIKNAASGIAGAGKYVGDKAGQAVGDAQQGVMSKIQQAGQFVGDKAKQAGQFVGDKATQAGQAVKQAGVDVKQQYHKGNANAIINNIQQDASKLGATIANFNSQAEKAGQQPIPVRSILQSISNQLSKGGNVNLQNKRLGEGGEDFPQDLGVDNGDEQSLPSDDMGQATFAPQQTLGVVAGKLGESEIKLRKYVQNRLALKNGGKSTLNESKKSNKLKQLDKMIDEQWELANKMK